MPKKPRNPRRKMTSREQRDLDVEIVFLEGVIRRDQDYAEALQILGDDYTRRDRFEDGLRIDQRLVVMRPRDALVHYNLACSYSLTQQCDMAAEALNTAISLGYKDFEWMEKGRNSNISASTPGIRESRPESAAFLPRKPD